MSETFLGKNDDSMFCGNQNSWVECPDNYCQNWDAFQSERGIVVMWDSRNKPNCPGKSGLWSLKLEEIIL